MDLRTYAEAQCEEMQKHRWIESEKHGRDLGDCMYLDWIKKYAKSFREYWESR
jgi:hypothetical protein